ncbi:MAG: NfeD family protein [Tumebacillaceae bacterium]
MWRLLRSVLACILLCAGVLAGLFQGQAQAASASRPVYVVPVENEIETGLSQSLQRAFQQASAANAQAVVLDIDTLGGQIDAAMEIGETIRSSKVPVIAYIRGKAISAGSYIALNSTHIAMAPGSTIGAAEARVANEPADPKIQAFWRSEMTAAAEFTHRDPQIAAGMVDRNIEIPGLKQKGELISLSAEQAVAHQIADGVYPSLSDALTHYGLQGADLQTYKPSPAEIVARFVTKPVVISILLILGLLGLTFELLLPGHILPGLFGVGCLGLYFFGNMVAGFAGWEAVIFFVVGLVLMIAEIFIAGFGIAFLLGLLSLGAGVAMAAYDTTYSLKMFLIAFLVSGVATFVVFKYFGHLGMWNRLILQERQEKSAGYTPTRNYRHLMYQVGRTVTPLRPAGTAVFLGQRLDVVSEGEFIPVDTEVQIVLIEGTRIVVRRKTNGDNTVIPRQNDELESK